MRRRSGRLVIVQERVPDYRVPFFDQLRDVLHDRGMQLVLLHGSGAEQAKNDSGVLTWGRPLRFRTVRFGRRRLTFSHLFRHLQPGDLVITEFAVKHTGSLALLLARALGRCELAWWGHGTDLQAKNSATSVAVERIKRTMVRRCDRVFAYTHGSAERFVGRGVPAEVVTVVNNSVDTSWASGLPGPPGAGHTCAYLGALYPDKRIDLLLDAADLLASRLPDFKLRILGDGELRDLVLVHARDRNFVTFHGRADGAAKAALLADVRLLLNPGLVGLVAIDSLASGRPIVTMRDAAHSPEVEYLDENNSYFSDGDTADEFAQAVLDALGDDDGLIARSRACIESAENVSLKAMVNRFADGVITWSEVDT